MLTQCVVCRLFACAEPLNADLLSACDTLGRLMAERGIELVYGGGNIGVMGAISQAVHKHGGSVIGIIPKVCGCVKGGGGEGGRMSASLRSPCLLYLCLYVEHRPSPARK